MTIRVGSARRWILAVGLVLFGCDSSTSLGEQRALVNELPGPIRAIMGKQRYAKSRWSLLVRDVASGDTLAALDSTRLSLTGSTRKLFSVAAALKTIGADRRQITTVHRLGSVGPGGRLEGSLVLVAGGDLTFGGRGLAGNTVQYTDFDHNDANGLGTAILTPQDPLLGINRLADQIEAAGFTSVAGDVVVDDRLFEAYRVPNGNLLITPMMLNENQIDVQIQPGASGQLANTNFRPQTAFFGVLASVSTVGPGGATDVQFSGDRKTEGVGLSGSVQGTIATDYQAPLSRQGNLVGTFRVEDPNSFARIALIEALQKRGIPVGAVTVKENPVGLLPPRNSYSSSTQVASFASAPLSEHGRLILKVSLNLGANLFLSLLGLEKGERTRDGSLLAERRILVEEFGLDGSLFQFPTNGSGTPDSQAAPKAIVDLLVFMARSEQSQIFQNALPVLGVDGSLATTGVDLPARGHVFAKTGTTISPDESGHLILKAQCLAGYIETRTGRKVAYALMVNDAGPVEDLERDVASVISDEAEISSLIYESF